MTTDNNWRTFFNHYAPQYMQEVFVRATLAEVDFLITHLHLTPGMSVLDIGCGTGRHAVELAKRGYHVTGVDMSSSMLAEAAKTAESAGVQAEWICSPAQDFRATRPYDAVYSVCEGGLCLFNPGESFDRDGQILAGMYAALKPGGYGLITVLNGMRFLRMYQPADVQAGRFDPLTLTEHGTMEYDTPAGKQSVATRERGYVPTELRLMLQHAGFNVERISGGTAGNWRLDPPDLDEMEIMAIMRRPA